MDHSTTVFVLDDDAAARDSALALALSKGLQAKGFDSIEAFLSEYSPTMKGCVIVDVRMAGMAGMDLLERLKAPDGSLPVIVTTNDGVALAVKAMQAGATTFLEKPCSEEELWVAIQQALDLEQTKHARRRQLLETHERLASLSEDEMEVFRRLLAGHANKRIASDFDIGLRTVELRRANIMKKMQATSLPDLVRLAILGGFLKADTPAEA
ncbi:MAG TPA: response regulator [Pirellulaceae bacterium]|jgi:FixJ family two-component response regulator